MNLMIPCTQRFVEALDGFNKPERMIVYRKIRLFMDHPTSPSLKVHRYVALENVWEFYVDRRMRVLFERLDGQPHFCDVGFHSVLEKACRYQCTYYTHMLCLGDDLSKCYPKRKE
ncbi:hypothetical protein KDI_51020 [Dictyobacter arantiisoli]|uniref:Uncharacterized protein n=1 Tax=Dictyobacter arantiisoli TaxID=2014874 RepID=A0A5A5TJX1_9CHLR|nr:hypothetical protein KDI_51020 [Dictyobacter arantiisoli]